MLPVRFTVGVQVHVKSWNKNLFEEWGWDSGSVQAPEEKNPDIFWDIL